MPLLNGQGRGAAHGRAAVTALRRTQPRKCCGNSRSFSRIADSYSSPPLPSITSCTHRTLQVYTCILFASGFKNTDWMCCAAVLCCHVVKNIAMGTRAAWRSSMCSWRGGQGASTAMPDHCTSRLRCCAHSHLHIACGQLPCGCQNKVWALHTATSIYADSHQHNGT